MADLEVSPAACPGVRGPERVVAHLWLRRELPPAGGVGCAASSAPCSVRSRGHRAWWASRAPAPGVQVPLCRSSAPGGQLGCVWDGKASFRNTATAHRVGRPGVVSVLRTPLPPFSTSCPDSPFSTPACVFRSKCSDLSELRTVPFERRVPLSVWTRSCARAVTEVCLCLGARGWESADVGAEASRPSGACQADGLRRFRAAGTAGVAAGQGTVLRAPPDGTRACWWGAMACRLVPAPGCSACRGFLLTELVCVQPPAQSCVCGRVSFDQHRSQGPRPTHRAFLSPVAPHSSQTASQST